MNLKNKFCPLLSIANATINKDFATCDPECALRIQYYQTSEGVNLRGEVCALTAKWLLDEEGRLKV